MNTSNLVKVQIPENESTGYFFRSTDRKKSFIITSKHSICNQKNDCYLYQQKKDGCCRVCPKEFDTKDIKLINYSEESYLQIEKIYYEKTKDLVIISVYQTATDRLIINKKGISDRYVAFGFNILESGLTSLVLDTPRVIDTLIYYNLHSNPTPNLIEKESNFQGISGALIFTSHEKYPTAKALIIHNENHNDFGAESLDNLNFSEINNFFKCEVFDQKFYIPEINNIKHVSQQNLKLVFNTINDFHLPRPKLNQDFEEILKSGRFIQITGLPGTGKSVLLRQIIESKVNDFPFLFVKSDQLVGSNNWLEYTNKAGLPSFSISEWLITLEAVGGAPIVFIDGIDKISENSRPIIEDLIHTVFSNSDLNNWKIVATLRNTGLELLNAWAGTLLKNTSIRTLNVEILSDDECNELAQKAPRISKLLFSDSKVKDIIRRPFFAKVLTSLNSNNFEPESELELIDEWWKRGGFNATGQAVHNRQEFLKSLSEIKAKNLSNGVKRRDIQVLDSLNSLVTDGLVCVNNKNSTVDFTHDIFFEWSLLYVLLEAEKEWLIKIESFGQPSFIARVVELLAQRELIDGEWNNHLSNSKFKELRPQWLKAWLTGPIEHSNFIELSERYTNPLLDNDFDLLNKLLTWFQAEKTRANPAFLVQSDKLEMAIQYPWPSDILLWQTFLEYIFKLIPRIPPKIYPLVLKIFEVWQYIGIHIPLNKTSKTILDTSIQWLLEISQSEKTSYWDQVKKSNDFELGLVNLILVSIQSEPTYIERYLVFLLSKNKISKEIYAHIVVASSIITQQHPKLLADLTLKFLLDEHPKERIDREESEFQKKSQHFEILMAMPVSERTKEQQLMIDRRALFFHQAPYQQIKRYDWGNVAIKSESRHFYPSSPLKEPFFSLLTHSEDTGLQLIRDLSNHAIQAWKQLCELSEKAPLPTIIEFPWGTQKFWGNEKEYIWKKPFWINNAISSAYMVLENWCFDQLAKGRSFDELIQRIMLGHESIAILGVVSVLALDRQIVSSSILPVVTNFKVLELDTYRFQQDLQEPSTTLISFQGESKYQKDIEAIRQYYNREGHKSSLEFLLRNYFINPEFREFTKDNLSNFKTDLSFNFKHEKIDESIINFLEQRADFYAEYVNAKNYFYQELENKISYGFNHPQHERQAESEEHKQLNEFSIFSNITYWAEESLKANIIKNNYNVESVIEFLKTIEEESLFLDSCDIYNDSDVLKKMKQNAFSALAAIILVFRVESKEDDLKWAREIVNQVVHLPYSSYEISCPQASLAFHPKKFLAQALASEIISKTPDDSIFINFINLIASPSHEISLVALKECFKLFDIKQKITWTAIYFALSLCKNHLKFRIYQLDKYPYAKQEIDQVYKHLNDYLKSEEEWCSLPIPDAPWIKLDEETIQKESERKKKIAEICNQRLSPYNNHLKWEKSSNSWNHEFAAEIIELLTEKLLHTSSQIHVLDFFESCLKWTIEKQEPSWLEDNQRLDDKDIIYEWNYSLSSALARIVGIFPEEAIKSQFLIPILNLKKDACWELLYPFVENYVCRYIYDAQHIPNNALDVLDLCLDRFLNASCFDKKSHGAGEISGLDLTKTAKSLMFVSIDQNAPLASRFVNGNWSEINLILPIVDKYIRAVGWVEYVIHLFLKLCERSIQNYPSNLYADQILELVSSNNLLNWNEQVHRRISSLIQTFVDKEKSMPTELRQKFLKIIDWLADHGDRGGSDLQKSDFFKNVRV